MDSRLTLQLRALGLNPDTLPPGTLIGGRTIEQLEAETKAHEKQKDRYKSKAERLYADRLEWRRQNFELVWWAYEPVTLVIVDANGERCRYTPDFMALTPEATVWFYEVKGHLREAARLRFLTARERYPFWNFQMVRRERDGGWSLLM